MSAKTRAVAAFVCSVLHSLLHKRLAASGECVTVLLKLAFSGRFPQFKALRFSQSIEQCVVVSQLISNSRMSVEAVSSGLVLRKQLSVGDAQTAPAASESSAVGLFCSIDSRLTCSMDFQPDLALATGENVHAKRSAESSTIQRAFWTCSVCETVNQAVSCGGCKSANEELTSERRKISAELSKTDESSPESVAEASLVLCDLFNHARNLVSGETACKRC